MRNNERITRTWFLHLPRWRTSDPAPTNWKLVNWWFLMPMVWAIALTDLLHLHTGWPIFLAFLFFLIGNGVHVWRRGAWCAAYWHQPYEPTPGVYECQYCGCSLRPDEVAEAVNAQAQAATASDRPEPQAKWSNRR